MQMQIWVDTQYLRLLYVSEAEVQSLNFLSCRVGSASSASL